MDMSFSIQIAGLLPSCPVKDNISNCWNVVFLLYIQGVYFLGSCVCRGVRKKEKSKTGRFDPLTSTTIELLIHD